MELKRFFIAKGLGKLTGLNCTVMELKLIYSYRLILRSGS